MKARKKTKGSHFCLSVLVFCCIAVFIVSRAVKGNKVMTEEIYEIDSAYVSQNIIAYFCMVCDPPSQSHEIIDLTDQYLTEEKVNDFVARAGEKAESLGPPFTPLSDVWVIFIEPSERLGVGEFPEADTILSCFPEDHMIRHVRLGTTRQEADPSILTD